MRPAYNTRCWQCGVRLSVSDEWRIKTIDKKEVRTFDPDAIITSQHKCSA